MAEDKLTNTSQVTTNVTSKAGMVTDLNSSYLGEDNYSHARNAVRNSKEGDLGTIGNEPSNILCFEAPYNVIGHITLPDESILIFSTDNVNSEIGIGNSTTCSYQKILNLPCLNFSLDHPITGVAKKDFYKGVIATFTDKYNAVRRLELKTISTVTNCEELLLHKLIDQPCLTVSKGQVGNMPNGMYSAVIGYVVDGKVFSDFYSISDRIALNSETGSNSLEVNISGLDSEFDQYSLVIVGSFIDPITKGVTKLAKQVGIFSSKTKTVSVTDFINTNYIEIPLSNLVIQSKTWAKAGIISSNSNYLLLGDLVGRDEENYQLKAMSIKLEYVVEQVLADYYEEDGRDVGYYRDENYDFYIQGVYSTGEMTDKYHIPGRLSSGNDMSTVSSIDVYEYDKQFSDCDIQTKIPRWKVENTAEKMIPYNNEFKCDRRILGRGKFGYHQSTDLYPDNPAMFGEWANTPIRHHRFPDESKVPRYQVINGKQYINIIGVRVLNVPEFDSSDIVGYKITRSDRKGGNGTVNARGIMTNMRWYDDISEGVPVMYNNYTVNDLSPDQYLSSTQTVFKNNQENFFTPLTNYYTDRFAFHSPHTSFEPRYTLGTEIKIEAEEIADVEGQFKLVHEHPKQKLMTQFTFWLAAAVGFIETALVLIGKRTDRAEKEAKISAEGVSSGTSDTWRFNKEFRIESVEDLVGLNIVDYVKEKILARDFSVSTITSILTVLASLSIKIPYSILSGIKAASDIFDIIYDFTGFTDYVYQYNSVAKFTRSIPTVEGNKRRRLKVPATYISPTVHTVSDTLLNNLHRERFVYLELNKPIKEPSVRDNTRQTATSFGICDDITKKVKSTASVYYATSKSPNPNQYGQLGSAGTVAMHSCVLPFEDNRILYGGDCIITRFNFLKKMPFFSQNIAGTNYQPGTEYDYRKYRNIGFPRFWIDSTKYDFSELLSSAKVNYSKFSRTTSAKHNLDCKRGDNKNIARIDDAYMYLSNNAAIEFFVECDYHAEFREKTEVPFYSKKNTDITNIFREDRMIRDEEFVVSRAYADLYPTEVFALAQRSDYDPADPIPSIQSNSVIYSLASFNLQNVDNWQYFLPANYFSFRESDYGELTAMHKLDQDRIIFLFSKASPFISMGRDVLQLEESGRKVTIGDGGLFAQDPREIMPTDNNYGACNSRYAFSNTHLGRFYPSEKQGRILSFTENLDDISRQGLSYWCKTYMPIYLYNYFPDYPQKENPVNGVGYLSVFDSHTETVYITKRDFSPKRDLPSPITWNGKNFLYRGDIVSLRDPNFFNDISWTLSYSPIDKGFVSFHDWHPDWVIQRDNHFLTVKGKGVWKHNEAFDSFCKFYGKDYPFEVEFVSNSGQQIHTVRSLEYFLEVFKYKNFGRDRFHVHHENYSHLIVRNTEQISPLCHLLYRTGDPQADLAYPIKSNLNPVMFDVLFSKEENKYRVNQFWDTTKDRGEFTSNEWHLFPTDESGYKNVINPTAIDLSKPEEQRKKFRHYWNKFRLIKDVSGPNKFITKLYNIKKLLSTR